MYVNICAVKHMTCERITKHKQNSKNKVKTLIKSVK